MDENTTPNSDQSTLENALKQIQAWFVNGEFEKVKRGCTEILQISPDNSIAQDLLQKAEEALGGTGESSAPTQTEEAPTPKRGINPSAIPTAATEQVLPSGDSLEIPAMAEMEAESEPIPEPQPEPVAEPPMPEQVTAETAGTEEAIPMPAAEEPHEEEHHRTHSLIVNIGILVALIVLGIVGVYAYQAVKGGGEDNATPDPIIEEDIAEDEIIEDDGKGETDEEEIVEEIIEEEILEADPDAEKRNNQRLTDLTSVENALIYYYDAHKQYPTTAEINTFLIDEGFIESIPVAPQVGEVYFYAVYDTDLGPAQTYILSGIFENEDGTLSPWSTGASALEYPEFQDVSLEEVTILSETLTEEEYLEAAIEIEVEIEEVEIEVEEEETEERVRVPRVVTE